MFNDQFYPTPKPLIDLMMAPYVKEYRGRWGGTEKHVAGVTSMLEPECGKADIPDHLVEEYGFDKRKISCIEIEPELMQLTQAKGYKVIDTDFLTFSDLYHFDFIVMNPPWRNGAEHLLKAWDVVAEGGRIVCVLNAETIRNAETTKRRLLMEIIERYGRVEEVGKAFLDAERPTAAEAVIIWLEKPKKEDSFDFNYTDFEKDRKVDEFGEYTENALASASRIKALVDQYEAAKAQVIEINRLEAKYRFYTQGVVKRKPEDVEPEPLNDKINNLKALFWKYVFEDSKMGKITTSAYQERFMQLSTATASLSFNVVNIEYVLQTFLLNYQTILLDCLVAVFEKATNFAARENRIDEGWKTNSSWRLAKKIIIPYGIEYNQWGSWTDNWQKRSFYEDLDKVMCYIDGRRFAGILSIADAIDGRIKWINSGNKLHYAEKFDTTYFQVRFYKKGTVHLWFKDETLWQKFNIKAAEGKNWIGEGN